MNLRKLRSQSADKLSMMKPKRLAMQLRIFRGNFFDTPDRNNFRIRPGHYMVVAAGKITLINEQLPEAYQRLPVTDFGERLIIPGFVDLHSHAPQFRNAGLGMDNELLPWLDQTTFPEESHFGDLEHAANVYQHFLHQKWLFGILHSTTFLTIHYKASLLYMRLAADSGLVDYPGKVNMDRNVGENHVRALQEDTETSLSETEALIKEFGEHPRVRPIITPRFVPTCSPELMAGLGKLANKYQLPVQSHINENRGEINWVKELHGSQSYAQIYDQYGLLGQTPTIMAHNVHPTGDELRLLKKRGVFIAHCAHSNRNLASGHINLRRQAQLNMGIGADIGAGHTLSPMDNMVASIQASKIKVPSQFAPLSEAFYLATRGGGSFFGDVGIFEQGFPFDALVINDQIGDGQLIYWGNHTLMERLQRFVYLGDDRHIETRYLQGQELPSPRF